MNGLIINRHDHDGPCLDHLPTLSFSIVLQGEIMWCWIAYFHVPISWICKGVVSSTEVHNWNYNSSKWWGVLNHPFRYYLVFFSCVVVDFRNLLFGCIARPAFFMIFGLLPVPVGKQFVYSIEFCFGFGWSQLNIWFLGKGVHWLSRIGLWLVGHMSV